MCLPGGGGGNRIVVIRNSCATRKDGVIIIVCGDGERICRIARCHIGTAVGPADKLISWFWCRGQRAGASARVGSKARHRAGTFRAGVGTDMVKSRGRVRPDADSGITAIIEIVASWI